MKFTSLAVEKKPMRDGKFEITKVVSFYTAFACLSKLIRIHRVLKC